MNYLVLSDGPKEPSSVALKMVADVDIYVARITEKGHRNVRVGSTADDAQPYETWRATKKGDRARGFG